MSRARLAVMVITLAALVALGWWQYRRTTLVRACAESGKLWDGERCVQGPGAPILQRELQRS